MKCLHSAYFVWCWYDLLQRGVSLCKILHKFWNAEKAGKLNMVLFNATVLLTNVDCRLPEFAMCASPDAFQRTERA